ncbi:MAG: lysylphosphatidylglycerol synthase domain-containing protein [Salinivirgaceae bacterium]
MSVIFAGMDWKNILIRILKIGIIAGSIYFIGYRLWNEYQSGVFAFEQNKLTSFSYTSLLLVFTLVFVNWFIESIKWRQLLIPVQLISFSDALKSVLAGISVSIFTPNRIGEFGGRILILQKSVRMQGVFASLVGNFAQTLVTLIAGVLFFPFYIQNLSVYNKSNEPLLVTLSVIAAVVGLLLFFNIKKLAMKVLIIPWFKKKQQFFNFLLTYARIDLLKCLGFSALRYLIFTFQFYLLLNFFGVQLSYTTAIIAISQVFL